MAKSVVARWSSEKTFDVSSGLGGQVRIVFDEGVDGYRPPELLLSALAGCTGMDVVSICGKKRQIIDAYEVRVHGEQRTTVPPSFRHIDVEHRLRGQTLDPIAVARSIELSATRYCTVSRQLSTGDVSIASGFRLGVTGCSDDELGDLVHVVTVGPHGAGIEPHPASEPPEGV